MILLLFDNGYIYLYIQYGILGFLLISWLIISSCNYVNKIYDIRKAVILISYIIYIFTESFSPNIFMNIILFCGTCYFSPCFERKVFY